jgi:predicted membrane chloride channel (bestrophin family)
MMKNKMLSKLAFVLSLLAVIMAGVVSFTQSTIWIAGTQWILVAIVLAVYAVFLDGEKNQTG